MPANDHCPFCIKNGLVNILKENEIAYIVGALDGAGKEMPNRYLIIPKQHVESILNLPGNWQSAVNDLLGKLVGDPPNVSFNLSYNQGKEAGQSVRHIHAWVICRYGDEDVSSRGRGLASLLQWQLKLDNQ